MVPSVINHFNFNSNDFVFGTFDIAQQAYLNAKPLSYSDGGQTQLNPKNIYGKWLHKNISNHF